MTSAGELTLWLLTATTMVVLGKSLEIHMDLESASGGTGIDIAARQARRPISFESQSQDSDRDHNTRLVTFVNQFKPLKFEETNYSVKQTHNIRFDESQHPENQTYGLFNPNDNLNSNDLDYKPNAVTFVENNHFPKQKLKGHKQKKRRRRRRKPKQISGLGYPGLNSGQEQIPLGPNLYENQRYPAAYPGYPASFYRPHRRPQQSPAAAALSAATRALESIALYDDRQCVPRLLCEAASGGALAKLGDSPVLQSIANLQPLLALLAAYNGAATSPLFVFGRAVFLGMTSRQNPGTCRYAYSFCPTDPEQLVHYLNNHNGGFFRFFNAPHLNAGQQNVEQFYDQLANPGLYGLQSNFNQPALTGQYGLQVQPEPLGNYGLYPSNTGNQFNNNPQINPDFLNQNLANQNYGLYPNVPAQNPYIPSQDQILNNYNQQNYGRAFLYKEINGLNQNSEQEVSVSPTNIAQKRIQNIRPTSDQQDSFIHLEFDGATSNWVFPQSQRNEINKSFYEVHNRRQRQLKFPDNIHNTMLPFIYKQKGFAFPDAQSDRLGRENKSLEIIANENINEQNESDTNNTKKDYNSTDGYDLVYILRGDGDPNHPEVVRVKAGETVQ